MFGRWVSTVGAMIMIGGLAIEGVGALALVSYPIHRRLPSPFALLSIGGLTFFTGVILIGIGGALAHASS